MYTVPGIPSYVYCPRNSRNSRGRLFLFFVGGRVIRYNNRNMDIIGNFKRDKPLFVQSAGLFICAAALPFSVTFIQGGLLLFIAAGLWRRHASSAMSALPGEIKANPLFIPWLIYLAAGALAAAFGINPARSFAALGSDLLTVVSFFGLALFLEPEQRDTALKIYLAAIAAAALYGIFQALGGLTQGLNVRAHMTSHPVRFGEIMAIGLGLAVSRLSFPADLSPGGGKTLSAAALMIIAAIVLSQTRGAYIGTALLFAAIIAIKRPPKRVILPLIAAAAALGLGLSAMNPVIRYKMGSIFKGARSAIDTTVKAPDQPIGTRLVLWKTGFKMIKDRPLLGAGPGSVKKLFPLYCPEPYPENIIWGSLHNLYIHQTAERGVVGLAALLILFISMFRTSLRSFLAAPSSNTIWALAIMAPWFSMNMTEITFQHVHTSYAVLLSLAVSLTASKSSGR